MKVYVIMAGEYSDRHIEAVFTDSNQAYNYANARNHSSNYLQVHVEEYETDTIKVESDFKAYTVSFDEEGCVCEAKRDFYADKFNKYEPNCVSILSSDIEHAIKIACDLKAQYEAEKLGIGV